MSKWSDDVAHNLLKAVAHGEISERSNEGSQLMEEQGNGESS